LTEQVFFFGMIQGFPQSNEHDLAW